MSPWESKPGFSETWFTSKSCFSLECTDEESPRGSLMLLCMYKYAI